MKKKIIISSLGAIAMTAAGLTALFTTMSTEDETIKKIDTIQTNDAESDSTSGTIFDPSLGSIITAPVDIRAEVPEERDPNRWYSSPAPSIADGTDWDYTQDAIAAWDYALEYGWTQETWSYYMNYMIEFNYTFANDFGVRFYWDKANWQQPSFGSATSAFAGGLAMNSDINPVYHGSLDNYDEDDLANSGNPANIDENDKKWYLYTHNGQTTWFMFDEDNLENGWRRLADGEQDPDNNHVEAGMGILEFAGNVGDITSYEGEDAIGNVISPDHFFVNGELLTAPELNSREEYYYVNHSAGSVIQKVTDDLGWPVLVTKPSVDSSEDDTVWTYDKLFSSVLNPTDPTRAVDFDSSFPLTDIYGENNSVPADEIIATKVEYGSYTIENHATGFLPLALRDGGTVTDAVYADDSPFWNGYYKLTYKKDSFYDHLRDPRYYQTQQSGKDGGLSYATAQYGKWSMFPGQKFMPDHYDTGGYTYVWVEDGNGGHKIFKTSQHLPFEKYTASYFPTQSYWTTDRFWGNWHYAFQSPQNFKNATEHYTDRKI